MDCCSKYSQYRNHSMVGGNIDNRNNMNNGNIGYYSHLHHSSLRYQQQQQQQQQPTSIYRLNNSSGSIYNGIGPPPPTSIPISSHTNLHHQNYDHHRYGHSYTNLSSYSSYTNNNSNSYNCNNVNFRGMMNDYYNHCDSYTRMNGIGGSTNFSYYGYRDFYADINLHHNPRINSYNNMYTNPLGVEREFHHHHHHQHHQHHSYHQNIGYYHTLPNSYYNNNNHHHRYLYHHNHHAVIGNNNYNNSQLRGASKDTFISRISSDIHKSNLTITNEKDLCNDTENNLNNLHTSSVSPSLQTNTTNNNNNNNNSSCIDDTNKLEQFHRNYNSYSNCKTDPNYNDDTIDEKINNQQQHSTISNDTEENQTDHQSYESNEYKSKKSITKDKDKLPNRQNSANRKAECSTPMNNLSTFDHDGSSFTSDNYFYSTKTSNYSNLQNGYHSPSQSSSCCSPFSNSPNNWNQRYSPKLSRKRCRSPKSSSPSSSSLISSITINKNRILEFDFIPSKKSKRKIKSESSEENYEYREEIKGITPLPGFQQAFGSTEIGRFSETFFSAIDSPIELRYESEADTLSPQPWETGDSLDGPHYNLYIGASVQPMFSDNFNNSIDSSIDSNHFNEIQCSDY